MVRKAETTAGEAAGTRSSVFVAVEVCASALSDRCLRWRVRTEGALGNACWCRPARREDRRQSTRCDQLGSEHCKDRYVCSLRERCLLEQLRVARVRAVEPQNIDICFCKVDPAWLLRQWNSESATCRAVCPRAFRGQGFPCPAVGSRRGKEMVPLLVALRQRRAAAGVEIPAAAARQSFPIWSAWHWSSGSSGSRRRFASSAAPAAAALARSRIFTSASGPAATS